MRSTLLFVVLLVPTIMLANPSGRSGGTSTMSAGCGDCHGNSKAATTVSLESGPRKVEPGSTTTFTIVVAHATMPRTGVGIAVRTTQTGTTNIGTLGVITGGGLRLTAGEITQSAPKAMSAGSTSFTFTWKAPAAEGTYFMQAVGNAVNGNGNNDAGDSWNWLQPIAITVEMQTSVAEDLQTIPSTFPNPCNANGTVTLGLDITGPVNVQFLDIAGNVVHAVTAQSNGMGLPLEVPALPTGTYMIVVNSGQAIRRTTMAVVR